MDSKFKWIPRIVTGLLTYLLASAPLQKLLFFEDIFFDHVHTNIFDHLWLIVIFLIIIYIVAEFIVSYRNRNKTLEIQCHNISRYIYKCIEKELGQDFAPNIRVTVFKAFKPNTEDVYIKPVCRYQKMEPLKKSKIKFKPGQGCAGVCFQTQNLVMDNLPEYNEKNASKYYEKSFKSYNMEQGMVDKLNIKSSLYLGIPIKCFDSDKTWGVLLIDSPKNNERFNNSIARKLELIIDHYTVFFTEEDK